MGNDQLREEITDYLKWIAKENDVHILEIFDSDSNLKDAALPNSKLVIMNLSFKTRESYCFRLAHELSHILFGDSVDQQLYAYSPLSHKSEEILANTNAIRLLLNYSTPASVESFMQLHHLPGWLEGTVLEEIEEYYLIKKENANGEY